MCKYIALRIFRGPERHIGQDTYCHLWWEIKGTGSVGLPRVVFTSFLEDRKKQIDDGQHLELRSEYP